MRYAALLLILFAGTASAETFKCQSGSHWKSGGKIVVTTTIHENGETGVVEVAGASHPAFYRVAGFNRRWDFGFNDDGTFDYSFILDPDGTGSYIDFSMSPSGVLVKPSQFFVCQ